MILPRATTLMCVPSVTESLGDEVMRPFLQDTVMFESLGKTLLSMAVTKPLFVPEILVQAGSSNRGCLPRHSPHCKPIVLDSRNNM